MGGGVARVSMAPACHARLRYHHRGSLGEWHCHHLGLSVPVQGIPTSTPQPKPSEKAEQEAMAARRAAAEPRKAP
eukprot:14953366-Alexandrium_andersonii.AAC.1